MSMWNDERDERDDVVLRLSLDIVGKSCRKTFQEVKYVSTSINVCWCTDSMCRRHDVNTVT